MTDPMVVRPIRRGRYSVPVVMLVVGVLVGVGLDRAWIELGPRLSGKPRLVGQWVNVASKEPIEFNADGSYAWEIPIIDMSGGAAKITGGNRQVSTWKWIDNQTIELGRSTFGRQNVKMGVAIAGDLLRLSEDDGTVLEYTRK
jgi:hypothetical protein